MSQENGHYMYYPGCSLKATSRAYGVSTEQVAKALGLTLQEIKDWNCCGATEYFSIEMLPAYSLVARNLALAAAEGSELIAPCSLCFLNLHKTDHNMKKHEKLNQQVGQSLKAGGLAYEPGSVRVRHLLNAIVEDVGFDAIKEKVKKPLQGLRLAPYYGCLITRPYSDYSAEQPVHMDELIKTLGAEAVDYPTKTDCCGGHMTQISEETAYELIHRILKSAQDARADAIVTACPMCQLNLDAYQPQVNRMFNTKFDIPILYFTQVMGIALGLDGKALGIGSEIVSAGPVLKKIGQKPAAKPKKPKRRDKKALPMPPK